MSRSPDDRGESRDLPRRRLRAPRPAHARAELRRYRASDEDAAIELWLRTWRAAYPQIDFTARLDWWRARWRDELVRNAEIVIAEFGDGKEREMVGFATVDPRTLYLDQIAVLPERWGSGIGAALLDAAKRISPAGLDLDVNVDNARAIRFYEKHGFSISGAGVNPISRSPVHRMSWRPTVTRPPTGSSKSHSPGAN
jgi:putative acetyltransferase